MKKNIWILGLLCIASSVVTRAQDSLSVELQADVVTQNIWRGTNLGHVSIQPEMAIGWKGLRLSAWGTVGSCQLRMGGHRWYRALEGSIL
jgi:hypothetical protein